MSIEEDITVNDVYNDVKPGGSLMTVKSLSSKF